MPENPFIKKLSHTFSVLLFTLLVQSLTAQTSPLILSWDRLGCQQDSISKVNFDENLDELPCLKVCKSTTITYRISGEHAHLVDYVKWDVTGGVKEDEKDLFAMPITWDNTAIGTLRIEVMLIEGGSIVNTVCINKLNSSLIFGWDKIGCQMNKDNVSEVKLDGNFSSTECLKVCEGSNANYSIYGNNSENIERVDWTIIGGSTNAQNGSNNLSIPIEWDNTSTGTIELHITFNNGSGIDKVICVEKIQSTLLLDWERIEESSIRQIKFDNSPDNAEVIMAYPESTVLYKIDGKSLPDVESIEWIVTGGYAYNPNDFATLIFWEDADEASIQTTILFKNGTSITRYVSIVLKKTPGGNDAAPISLKFNYDDAGNQIQRKICINCAARHKGPGASGKSNAAGSSKNYFTEIDKQISYYPNPVSEELFLKWENSKRKTLSSIELSSLSGQQLKSYNNLDKNQDTSVNFSQYPSGNYNLLLIYSNGEKTVLKIIKQ